MIDAADESFRWTDAGGFELLLLGFAVLLTLAVAAIFVIVLLRGDRRKPATSETTRSLGPSGSARP